MTSTDPDHENYWGPIHRTDQRMVEAAALGFALALAPDQVWEPLDERARQNLADWLRPVYEIDLVPNNWQFFRVMVHLGLTRVGVAGRPEAVEQSLELLESYDLGEGWYRDGDSGSTDFYVPFAMHFYGLVYATCAAGADPERARRFRDRAAVFAAHRAARFDEHGRVIAHGRSLTYRFAGVGFFGALALANVEALPWGRLRGLWARHLRWWAEQQISDERGGLAIGWAYPNLMMAEPYNSPASPYWALKAFLPLALPADHPFWTAEEDVEPPLDSALPQPLAGVVVQHSLGQAQMLNAGVGRWALRHGSSKYGKLAYSSAFLLCLDSDDAWSRATAESALVFIDPVRDQRETRWANLASGVEGDVAWARWQALGGDATVVTFMRQAAGS